MSLSSLKGKNWLARDGRSAWFKGMLELSMTAPHCTRNEPSSCKSRITSRIFTMLARATQGMPRRCWSVAEIEEMVRVGIIHEDERFELIGGEVVPLSPKGGRHEWMKGELNRFFQRAAPDHLSIAPATALRLDARTFVEPDFCVFRRNLDLKALDGPAVLLAIEVADSSLNYDKGRKIGIYAAYGVREVWVVDALRATIWIHRKLGAEGYAEIAEFSASEISTPMLAPELAVRLSNLGIAPATGQA